MAPTRFVLSATRPIGFNGHSLYFISNTTPTALLNLGEYDCQKHSITINLPLRELILARLHVEAVLSLWDKPQATAFVKGLFLLYSTGLLGGETHWDKFYDFASGLLWKTGPDCLVPQVLVDTLHEEWSRMIDVKLEETLRLLPRR